MALDPQKEIDAAYAQVANNFLALKALVQGLIKERKSTNLQVFCSGICDQLNMVDTEFPHDQDPTNPLEFILHTIVVHIVASVIGSSPHAFLIAGNRLSKLIERAKTSAKHERVLFDIVMAFYKLIRNMDGEEKDAINHLKELWVGRPAPVNTIAILEGVYGLSPGLVLWAKGHTNTATGTLKRVTEQIGCPDQIKIMATIMAHFCKVGLVGVRKELARSISNNGDLRK